MLTILAGQGMVARNQDGATPGAIPTYEFVPPSPVVALYGRDELYRLVVDALAKVRRDHPAEGATLASPVERAVLAVDALADVTNARRAPFDPWDPQPLAGLAGSLALMAMHAIDETPARAQEICAALVAAVLAVEDVRRAVVALAGAR